MNQYREILRNLIWGLGFSVLTACNSTSPVKSSSPPSSGSPSGSPSSPGSSGSPSSPGSSSRPSSQSGQMGGIQSPSSAGMPQTGIGQSGQQAGTDAGQAKAPAGSRGQSDRAKTDEQILADALGEFDKEAGAPQHGAATNPLPASSASGAGQGELTEAEKTQDLNQELDERFARFDDLMRGERDSVAKKENADGSGGYGTEDGFGNAEGEGDAMQTAMIGDSPPPPRASSDSGLPKNSALPSQGARPPPADVGNGVGDDVIARQLREAAMKEQDPELQAKLWEEYRKYKGGTS